jgi:hypothetical protein
MDVVQLHLNGIFVLVQLVFGTVAGGLTDFVCCHPYTVLLQEAQQSQHMHDTSKSPSSALLIASCPAHIA